MLQLGELPPPGYTQWATAANYWAASVRAYGELAPAVTAVPDSPTDILTPPMRTHVASLIALAESLSDLPIGQLASVATNIAALAQVTDPAQAVVAVQQLLTVGIDIASSVAGAVSAEAAAAMAEVVPIIGTIVNTMLAGLVAGLQFKQAMEAAKFACHRDLLTLVVTPECRKLLEKARPEATSPGAPTPADLFRPLRYAFTDPKWSGPYWTSRLGGKRALPLSVASVYVALCGKDVVPIWSGFPDVPIPLATRKRMWTLIQALMEAGERPGFGYAVSPAPDGGRALFAPLQDIVLRQRPEYGGQLTDTLVRAICNRLGAQYVYATNCPPDIYPTGSAGAGVHFEASCATKDPTGMGGVEAPLSHAWTAGLRQYEEQLELYFKDPVTGAWLSRPRVVAVGGRKVASLVLSNKATATLQSSLRAPRSASAGQRAVAGASVATIAGAGAAALAFLL